MEDCKSNAGGMSTKEMGMPTLFLDVDSTVVVTESGGTFPKNPKDWKFNGDILEYIATAVDRHMRVILVSNQAGVMKAGLKPAEVMVRLNDIRNNIELFLYQWGHQYYQQIELFVPMSSKSKLYKGPNTCAETYERIVPFIGERSIMIGDADSKETSFSDSDKVFAGRLGIKTFMHPNALLEMSLKDFAIMVELSMSLSQEPK